MKAMIRCVMIMRSVASNSTELDSVVSIAKEIGERGGVFGCRMTGGGFGGSAVALIKADKVDLISDKISTEYKRRTGIEAAIFTSRPGSGAQTI
jgi:galactokinase